MSGISTHVLDTSGGVPAGGVAVRLERFQAGTWAQLASAVTDADGRVKRLLEAEKVMRARHRLTFAAGEYFALAGQDTLYPEVVIVFDVVSDGASYHIPLLLSPFGYTTYRGT